MIERGGEFRDRIHFCASSSCNFKFNKYLEVQIVPEFLLKSIQSTVVSQLTCSQQWDQLVPVLACRPAWSSGCHISIWQFDLWTLQPLEVNGSPSPPSVFSLGRSNHPKHGRMQRKQWKRRMTGWLSESSNCLIIRSADGGETAWTTWALLFRNPELTGKSTTL